MPAPDERLQGGDTLLVEGKPDALNALYGLQELEVAERMPAPSDIESERVGMMEMVLSPHTTLAGTTLRELHFREKYDVSVLAIWREGRAYHIHLGDMPLRFGDALLLYGSREKLNILGSEPDFVVLTEAAQEAARVERAPVAALVLAGVVATVLLGWLHISIAAVIGATLMVLLGASLWKRPTASSSGRRSS